MVTLDGTLTFFITLELCAGGDLAARLARARGASAHLSNSRRELAAAAAPPAAPIADAVAARWAVALAAGVAAVHAAHVAHRDLKPANVLLSAASDERAALKISDFGLARQAFAGDEHGGFSTRLGTVAYAAPELLDAQAHRDGARYDGARS